MLFDTQINQKFNYPKDFDRKKLEQYLDAIHMSARYKTEDSFLKGTLQFIGRKIKDPESYLDFWNYLDEIDIIQFKDDLEDLKKFVINVIDTPLSERGEPPFK